MTFLEIYGIGTLAILGLMTILWIVSLVLRNSSIVDIFWGPGFVLANWVYFALTPEGFPGRKWLIGILVTIWGLRLGSHILWRNWGKGEDFRYQKWRDEAGAKWWWFSFFKVFLLQGILLWVISAPLLAAQVSPRPARFDDRPRDTGPADRHTDPKRGRDLRGATGDGDRDGVDPAAG